MPALPIPRETLMHVVKAMPAAPRILSRLSKIRLDPNIDLDDVTALLRVDAALTARIIRVANSAVYCQGEPYSSIEQALARVGFSEIYMIASFAAMAQITDQNLRLYNLAGAKVRENSLLAALTAEALAGPAGIDAHEAYSAGLLRSVGKIGLEGLVFTAGLLRSAKIPVWGQERKDAQKSSYAADSGRRLGDWETEVIGMNNCEAGEIILNEWHFPPAISTALGGHYVPEQAPGDPQLAALLNLAAGAADRRGFGLAGEEAYWDPTPRRLDAAGVSEEQLEAASEKGFQRFGTLRSAVG
jgi:HD-like signal output (HDOD) protein